MEGNPSTAEVGGTLPSTSARPSYARALDSSKTLNPWKEFKPDFRLGVKDGIPSISFAPQDLIRAELMVSNALVLKFSAGRPSVDEIRSHIELHWGVSKILSIGAIDSRHILLRLPTSSDVTTALAREKKHIKGFWFRLFQWSSSFDPKKESALAPVWITFPKLPIHFFNPKMLEGIASLVGRFIKTDSPTIRLSRPSVARVCVEVDLTKPIKNEIWINKGRGEGFIQAVEYEFLPKYCGRCFLQGHALEDCKKLKDKKQGDIGVPNAGQVFVNIPEPVGVSKQGDANIPNAGKVLVNIPEPVNVPALVETSSSVGMQEEPIILVDKKVEKANTSDIVKKKKRKSNKSKETLVLEEGQDVVKVDVNTSASPVKEAASTTSTDPSIPPGFENYNKFRVLEEEEEVATSKSEIENLEVSIHKPSSSEPIFVLDRKLSSKSKTTGLFPNGTLDTQKNCSPTCVDDSNKISSNKLVDFGSTLGLSFPSSKKKCHDMCSGVVNNHKHLRLEEMDESSYESA